MRNGQFAQWGLAAIVFVLAGCTPVRLPPLTPPTAPAGAEAAAPESTPQPPARQEPAASETPGPTAGGRWQELVEWSPYPHTRPLPQQAATPVDGRYVRLDPRNQARTPCRRCPPYPPEGGVWVLEFDAGIFRVYHPRTGWRTLGSYTVEGDRITLFNDPQCHLATGRFTWSRDQDGLHFSLLDDDCELGTRAKNFTGQTWKSCQPPNHEAGVTGHWPVPEGCDPAAVEEALRAKSPTLSQ
jgi:hypothetical protein